MLPQRMLRLSRGSEEAGVKLCLLGVLEIYDYDGYYSWNLKSEFNV